MSEVVVALSVPHTIAGAQVFPCWAWLPDAVAGHDIGPLTVSRGQNFPQEHLLVVSADLAAFLGGQMTRYVQAMLQPRRRLPAR